MAKVRNDFPADGVDVVAGVLPHFPLSPAAHMAAQAPTAVPRAANARSGHHIRKMPIPLYTLNPGEDLSAARQHAWRYLIEDHDHGVHKISDIAQNEQGESSFISMAELHPGGHAALTRFVAGADAEHELRWLEVPSAYLSALWAHGASGEQFLDMRSFQKLSQQEVEARLNTYAAAPGAALAPQKP